MTLICPLIVRMGRVVRVAQLAALLDVPLNGTSAAKDLTLNGRQLFEDAMDSVQVHLTALTGEIPVQSGEEGLVEVEEEVQTPFSDLEAWKVGEEVISNKKADKDKIIDDVLEVIRKGKNPFKDHELHFQILAENRKMQDLEFLFHVLTLVGKGATRTRWLACTILCSKLRKKVKPYT